MRRVISAFFVCAFTVAPLLSQTPKDYPDGHGGKVRFPLGDVSFADETISFEAGDPASKDEKSQPESAIGIPDYKQNGDGSYLTLGCGGTFTFRFVDNALVDVEGPDLYVFEVGPLVEAMDLAVSSDGKEWVEVGRISGGRADVDIAPHTNPGDVFHYVRLTDMKASCSGRWPGADVDAIGAIGAAIQFSLSGSVLFDTGKWDLKPDAKAEIDALAAKLATYSKGRVVVEGHTDNVGSDADNQTLSVNRAQAVLAYLKIRPELSSFAFKAEGHGESRPTATNETEEGQAKNRRVDVVLVPGS